MRRFAGGLIGAAQAIALGSQVRNGRNSTRGICSLRDCPMTTKTSGRDHGSPAPPTDFVVLSVLEAAQRLGLTEDHDDPGAAADAVLRLVREKGLRPIPGLGKSYKFTVAELQRWVQAQMDLANLDEQSSRSPLGFLTRAAG